jgi:hypothetical protein
MLGPRVVLVLAFVCASLGLESRVYADDKAELAAESLFAEGTRLMKADRCDEAVVKLRESQRLDPASGTALNIGYCEAKLGHVASAWLAYRQAQRLAQSQAKAQHEALAREQAAKLEPEVPHLVVAIGRDEPSSVSVRLDGAPLERDVWATPIPVDPGAHRVERLVAGGEPWEKTVTLARGEHVTVEVPKSPAAGAAPATVVAPPPPSQNPPPPPPRETPPPSGSSQRTWGYILGGAGVAAVVTGGALLVSARVQYDGAEDDCPSYCNEDGFQARESARTRAFVGMGVGGAGIVLSGVGLALVLTASDGSPSSDRSAIVIGNRLTPWALGFRTSY